MLIVKLVFSKYYSVQRPPLMKYHVYFTLRAKIKGALSLDNVTLAFGFFLPALCLGGTEKKIKR